MKQSGGLRRHKPLVGNLDTYLAWQDRTRQRAVTRRRERVLDRAPQIRSRPKDTGPSRKARRSLADRSGGFCEFPACWRLAEHDHHRGARGMGGSSNPAVNALSAQLHYCAIHHAYVEANPAEAYANGWKVRRGTKKPGDVLVLTRHSPFPVLLNDEGGYQPADTSSRGNAA